MPRGDRTGPTGKGAMTGRGLGFCTGFANLSIARSRGRAHGRGGAFGRGMRCGWFGQGYDPVTESNFPYNPAMEAAGLKEEIDGLEKTLAALRRRLDEVKGSDDE